MPAVRGHDQPAHAWYHALYQRLVPTLQVPRTCATITHQLLHHYLGIDRTTYVANLHVSATGEAMAQLHAAADCVVAGIPVQYVLGEVTFYKHTFRVTPDVLIPRPETEELVHHILQQERTPSLRLADLCTGSGCIAISLAKALLDAEVVGVDKSTRALAVAQANGVRLQAAVTWQAQDILQEELAVPLYDVLVSNPPYVPLGARASMASHVVNHEPHMALFVPDEDPLLFYKRLATLAERHLHLGGRLYLELYTAHAGAIAALVASHGMEQVRVYRDLQGRERWLSARKGT